MLKKIVTPVLILILVATLGFYLTSQPKKIEPINRLSRMIIKIDEANYLIDNESYDKAKEVVKEIDEEMSSINADYYKFKNPNLYDDLIIIDSIIVELKSKVNEK